jgi:hypothetical protein
LNELLIALVSFFCLSGSASLGWYLRARIPGHHLNDEAVGVIKLATGLVATMAALVLGLLISSAKSTFDKAGTELLETAAQVVQFDRVLARYGPQTADIRKTLQHNFTDAVALLAAGDSTQLRRLNDGEAIKRSEALRRQVMQLPVADDDQAALKVHALGIMDDVFAVRGLLMLQATTSIPPALLVALIAWLSIIFGTFGLFTPRNPTVVIVVLLCAFSTCASLFLIEELNRPLDGLIGVSLDPMRDTLSRLGH